MVPERSDASSILIDYLQQHRNKELPLRLMQL